MMNRRWMVGSVVCLCVFLLFAGWMQSVLADLKPAPNVAPVRIVCVGDSITEGYGLKNREMAYPRQLGSILGEKAVVNAYGAGGTTYFKNGVHPFWKTAFSGYINIWKPQVIVMAFGTNCCHPDNWKLKEQYADDVKALSEKLAENSTKPCRFFVCLPPPLHDNVWGLKDATLKEQVIPALREIASKNGFGVIDLRTPLLDKPELFPDGVHPNEAGMKIIAQTIAATLLKEGQLNASTQPSAAK